MLELFKRVDFLAIDKPANGYWSENMQKNLVID
jgi:hypothetical protein